MRQTKPTWAITRFAKPGGVNCHAWQTKALLVVLKSEEKKSGFKWDEWWMRAQQWAEQPDTCVLTTLSHSEVAVQPLASSYSTVHTLRVASGVSLHIHTNVTKEEGCLDIIHNSNIQVQIVAVKAVPECKVNGTLWLWKKKAEGSWTIHHHEREPNVQRLGGLPVQRVTNSKWMLLDAHAVSMQGQELQRPSTAWSTTWYFLG